jgi:hypothetical protein
VPSKPRFVALTQRVRQLYPRVPDPARLIGTGQVRVSGAVVSNPRAQIPRGAAVAIAAQPVMASFSARSAPTTGS